MNTPLISLTLRQKLRVDQRLRSLAALGWPALLGISLVLTGLLLMALSYRLEMKRDDLQRSAPQAERSNVRADASRLRPVPAVLPISSTYTADLAQIFDLAKSQGIVLTSGDYRDAERTVIPIDVRVVDLRLNESYTKLKEFLASVLNTMPHAAVQELRIERKDSASTRHQVLLKIALVYASTEAGPALRSSAPQQLVPNPPAAKEGLMP
jgi:hypothetical protein